MKTMRTILHYLKYPIYLLVPLVVAAWFFSGWPQILKRREA
jgi:hypothetical protein